MSDATPTTPNVSIYTTPTCHFCHLAKEYLQAHNIPFTEYDVATDAEQRHRMVEMTGQLGVPVIAIGEDIIIGFDEKRMGELLSISA